MTNASPHNAAASVAASPAYSDSEASTTSVTSAITRIDTIEITRMIRRNGVQRYVLDVYIRKLHRKAPRMLISPTELFFRTRQPHRPKLIAAAAVAARGEPDFQVERSFDEFVGLQTALHTIACAAHNAIPAGHVDCSCCSLLLECVNDRKLRPRKTLQLCAGSSKCMARLAAFTCRVVTIVTQTSQRHQGDDCCVAMQQAAALLDVFLRKPRESSLGII